MSNEKSFGELLAYHRSQFGISQEELAEFSGVSKTQIARYETNNAKPRRKAIEKLAKTLKVAPEDLGYRSLSQDKELTVEFSPHIYDILEMEAKKAGLSIDEFTSKLLSKAIMEEWEKSKI